MPEDNNFASKFDIELIKKDLSVINKLVDKFDTAIDKLQNVGSDLSRIVSLQEQKFTTQDRINTEVDRTVNALRMEHDSDNRKIDEKIDKVKDDLDRKIAQVESNILAELNKVKDDLHATDTWRYTVVGGIVVAAFILSKFIDVAKLFSH